MTNTALSELDVCRVSRYRVMHESVSVAVFGYLNFLWFLLPYFQQTHPVRAHIFGLFSRYIQKVKTVKALDNLKWCHFHTYAVTVACSG